MKLASSVKGASAVAGTDLLKDISSIVAEYRPYNVLETGTYHGTGSTRTLIRSLVQNKPVFQFHTIEVNAEHFRIANENILKMEGNHRWGHLVHRHHGLSVPASHLPKTIDTNYPDDVFIDYHNPDQYISEVKYFPQDDIMGDVIKRFHGKPDLVMLDSAGHMGLAEFDYLMEIVDPSHSFLLVLDDTKHIKHYKTMQKIKADARFEILKESDEKFGYAITKFNGN